MLNFEGLIASYAHNVQTHEPKGLPPENEVVICSSPDITRHEFEAMIAKAKGRSGLRWHIFNVSGRGVSYPHREWQPRSWRFKNKEKEN